MTTTAETVLNITGMAAELPLAVSVGLKYFAAVRTGKGIECLSLHYIDGNIALHRYPSTPCSITAQSDNFPFLFIPHIGHLLKI
jgi:hypothetical protein